MRHSSLESLWSRDRPVASELLMPTSISEKANCRQSRTSSVRSWFASTKIIPAISVGRKARISLLRIPPHEWATITYGGGKFALLRSRFSSLAMVDAVGFSIEHSLLPYPDLSYCSTRVKETSPRWTAAQPVVLLARPGMIITSGSPVLQSGPRVLSHNLWLPMLTRPDFSPVFQLWVTSASIMRKIKESLAILRSLEVTVSEVLVVGVVASHLCNYAAEQWRSRDEDCVVIGRFQRSNGAVGSANDKELLTRHAILMTIYGLYHVTCYQIQVMDTACLSETISLETSDVSFSVSLSLYKLWS